MAKWHHTTIYLQTGETHSCYHPAPHPIPLEELKNNPSALHNTQEKKQERSEMIAGKKPRGCSYCWKIEENGLWSIYGAREGCYLTNCTDWDYTQVRDVEYLTEQWNEKYSRIEEHELEPRIQETGDALNEKLGLEIGRLDSKASKFFKRVYHNTPRIVKVRR
jgi:hypothetical protein